MQLKELFNYRYCKQFVLNKIELITTKRLSKEKQIKFLQDWLYLENTGKVSTADIASLFVQNETDEQLSMLWKKISDQIDNGEPPEVLNEYFPSQVSSMILASYGRGTLKDILELSIKSYEEGGNVFVDIISHCKMSMVYICIMFGACFPYRDKFEKKLESLPIEDWQTISVVGYKTTIFVTDYGHYALMLLVAIFIGVVYSFENWVGDKRNNAAQKYPLYSDYRYQQVANILRTISILRNAGTRLSVSLDILLKSGTKYTISLLEEIKKRNVTDGKEIYEAFGIDGFLDPQDQNIIKEVLSREPTGDAQLFNDVSKRYVDKKTASTEQKGKALNLLLWLIIGYILVAVVAGENLLLYTLIGKRM